MRALLQGGVLAPSFVVSAALSEADIRRTVDVVAGACQIYRRALDREDPTPWLGGRPVRPVFRARG
jgi:glutamate-1-semialdehyde 2,1-aminomutase